MEEWVTSVQHPAAPGRQLHFIPDPPHILKNIRTSLTNGGEIILPPWFVNQKALKFNKVSIKHIQGFLREQDLCVLKPAQKLTWHKLKPSTFEKMDVGGAMAVLSRNVAAGMRFLVVKQNCPEEWLTTAEFIDFVARWFELMTSRHFETALSHANVEKYNDAISFLKSAVRLFKMLTFVKPGWKPIQTGVIASTMSILAVQEELLEILGFQFFMTSRCTQDNLESTFSVFRMKSPIPTPKLLKSIIKATSLAQYMRDIKGSSYQYDEADYIADFLDMETLDRFQKEVSAEETEDEEEEHFFQICGPKTIFIRALDEAVLYYMGGYTVRAAKKKFKTCQACVEPLLQCGENFNTHLQAFQEFKDYTGKSLVKCSQAAYDFIFFPAEVLFRSVFSDATEMPKSKNIVTKLIKMFPANSFDLPQCHNIKQRLLEQFFNIRLRAFARFLKLTRKDLKSDRNSSMSIEMRHRVDRLDKK